MFWWCQKCSGLSVSSSESCDDPSWSIQMGHMQKQWKQVLHCLAAFILRTPDIFLVLLLSHYSLPGYFLFTALLLWPLQSCYFLRILVSLDYLFLVMALYILLLTVFPLYCLILLNIANLFLLCSYVKLIYVVKHWVNVYIFRSLQFINLL